MPNIHDAIYALNSTIVTIRGDVAYDKNEQTVQYDMAQAQSKLVELQEQEAAAKQSALNKLSKLGLTAEEIKALVG